MVTIKQLGGDYGLQKLFGTFGAIIWGPISGVIIGKSKYWVKGLSLEMEGGIKVVSIERSL